MKRFLLWVCTFSFCGMLPMFFGCNQQGQGQAPAPVASPLVDQSSEIHNLLSAQAQQAVEALTRDREREQVIEALNRQQQDPDSLLLPPETN